MSLDNRIRQHLKSMYSTNISRRLSIAFVVLGTLIMLGTMGFWLLGRYYVPAHRPDVSHWSLLNCFYMMLITITTTGYGEILPGMDLPVVRGYTTVLLLTGMSVYIYVVAILTTFFVEGEFRQIAERRKMEKLLTKIHDHIIVCGVGTTGFHIIKELLVGRWPLVIVDIDSERVRAVREELREIGDVPYVIGDAMEDRVLEAAGVDRAWGLIAALPSDRDNLFITITAREMNGNLRIVSKAVDLRSARKMRIAGADSVVSTNFIGGLRMVSEMIRPQVVEFMDIMLRDKDKNLRVEELNVTKLSGLHGKTLGESNVRQYGNLLVIAVKIPETDEYIYGPGSDFVLKEGMVLVVLGETEHVAKLRKRFTKVATYDDFVK